ncbi:HIT family protein [Oleispirillum naphthae]|uniref:HIT family protein n=1 Tax=Oleispirillum naphthae TaxID=2838853 RepID=UPI0030824C9C
MPFELDPRLAADSLCLAGIGGCQVRMLDDARFPWLLLVPEHPGAAELFDLPEAERRAVLDLACRLGAAMKPAFAADKINIGALGNIVTQLHVHIVARRAGDAAWPGPVWGAGSREPMDENQKAAQSAAFRKILQDLEA